MSKISFLVEVTFNKFLMNSTISVLCMYPLLKYIKIYIKNKLKYRTSWGHIFKKQFNLMHFRVSYLSFVIRFRYTST